ncbi:MAG: DUF3991 domain-containing protein [Gammaproteobacteria bacterium]|nr:DUF3991 domain-containing protein [Gammaproteobacteria bacterium]
MSELEEFKTAINLTEYAAAQGFEMDRRKTSRNSVFMRHPGGDKIIIARELDGHWVYCSVTDESRGSIIDLVQDLQGGSLGDVRKELRPWIGKGGAVSRPPVKTYAPSVEPTSKDRQAVVREYEQMQPVNRLPYLEQVRGIPATVLSSPRFAGKISMDRHANAVFPHRDKDGVCGFELKNRNFTGFAKGGEKGLWFSVANKVDTRLVFAESGIDAISYAILYPEGAARYASTGGKMNPNQPALIQASIEKMPEGSAIIAAMDNDPDGRKLAGEIEQIVKATGRNDLVFRQHTPAEEGADWNNLLKAHIQKAPAGPLFG